MLNIGSKTSLKVGSGEINIEQQILFHSLIAVSDDIFDDTEEIFKYDLYSQSSLLFDSSGLIRVALKLHSL